MADFMFNIATSVLGKVGPLVVEEVLSSYQHDLKTLQETMSNIQATLLDAEEQQHRSEKLRRCMGKLRDIFCDAEDVLDEFECKALRKKVQKNQSISKTVRLLTALSFDSVSPVFALKTGHKIKDINQRLEEVYAEWNKFNLVAAVGGDNRRVIRRERETHSFVSTSEIIGREVDKEKIVSLLMEPTEPENIPVIPIIPIVGIGGLGKTVLTQLVYNDERVVTHFQSRIWECVSEEFDLTRLLKQIIQSITRAKVDDSSSLEALQAQLRNLPSNNRFLLVLDDVWNENRAKWIELRNLLLPLSSFPGSKIIVTTRSVKVASVMTPNPPYELQGLPHQDCMSLFTRSAFNAGDERRYPNLTRIGEEIVRKCKGIPLAVKTLGSLLFSKTEERMWMSIRDSEIWTLEQSENDILPMLKLSYDHLPSHLQRCLAFLSLYKKDHSYRSDDIISFWMANGLLEYPNQQYEEWEDVGSRYINELWSRGFIQDVEDEGLYWRFKMHDLIHDLALSVSQKECKTLLSHQSESIDEKIRHVSLYEDDKHPIDFAQVLKNPKGVRTIILREGRQATIGSPLVDFCVSNFKYLRMLDLRGSNMEALPNSIGKMKHLRYLDLRGCRCIRKLPSSLYKLQSLLFLKMTGVPLMELPDSMQSLISLRCLEISIEGPHLMEIRPDCWGSLQYLGIFQCDSLQSLFEGMQYLKSLRTLHLSSCNALKSLPRSLKLLTKLENLVIHSCLNLNLQMEPEDKGDHQLRLSLKTFSTYLLPASKGLPRLLLEGSSSTMQSMKIEGCYKFEVLPEWLQNLTYLEKLEIIDCPWLSSLPEGMDRLTALKQLKVIDCQMLSERCRKDGGADWPKIAHVQDVKLISS